MTYSIVARCPETGMLGMGIASAVPAVGRVSRYLEPGVGVVATQSVVLMAHGSRVLDGLRAGLWPEQALAKSIAADEQRAVRQVGVVSAAGDVAAHTGEACIAEAGHVVGEGFCAQANMMAGVGVPDAMAQAFTSSTGRLSSRILDALDAAEALGGDVRGRQAAALVVARAEATGDPLVDVVVDVRVDDSTEPLPELRRLERVAWAYDLVENLDELLSAGDVAGAEQRGAEAMALVPGDPAIPFELALALGDAGHEARAREAWARLVECGAPERWAETLRRIVAAGLVAPSAIRLVERD